MTANTEKKVGFWTYFMALNFGADSAPGMPGGRSMWELSLTALLFIWGIIFIGGDAVPMTLTFALFAFLAVISLCGVARLRPSMFHLMPVGRTRKTVFFFLSILLTMLIGMVLAAAAFAVLLLPIALIVLASSGEWIFVAEETGAVALPCLQGELLALILGAGIFGAGMIAACIKKKILQRLFITLTPVIAVAPLIVIMQFCRIEHGKLFLLFDTIPYSYVYLIVSGVIAAALLVIGALRIVRFLNPKRD